MSQDQSLIYYMVVDEKSTGPYSLEQIISHPALSPETLVWKPGIDNWVAAKTFPELAPAFTNQQPEQQNNQTPPKYNWGANPQYGNPSQYDGFRQKEEPQHNNPYPPYGQQSNNPGNQYPEQNGYGYGENQGDYNQGQGTPENNPFANNPQYNPHHNYNPQGQHNNYGGQYDQRQYNPYHHQNRYDRPQMRTNWLPWAIVATVLGFFTYCLGAIFGIIGIVQANKANTLYAQGFDREAEAANNNAKIMTIIGLVIAGIGLFIAIIFGSMLSSFYNFY